MQKGTYYLRYILWVTTLITSAHVAPDQPKATSAEGCTVVKASRQ